jgi:hypothetical protein
VCLLLAAGGLLGWIVPRSGFRGLVVAGAVLSIALQAIWISGWAVLPLAVDLALLEAVVGRVHASAAHRQSAT